MHGGFTWGSAHGAGVSGMCFRYGPVSRNFRPRTIQGTRGWLFRSKLRDQSRRVYAPLPAQHQLEDWLRAASSTSGFFAVEADARQAVRTACDIEGGQRWATKSVGTVTHSCLPCSGRALHVATCIGAESNLSASSMVFVFELEAIIYICRAAWVAPMHWRSRSDVS